MQTTKKYQKKITAKYKYRISTRQSHIDGIYEHRAQLESDEGHRYDRTFFSNEPEPTEDIKKTIRKELSQHIAYWEKIKEIAEIDDEKA